MPSIVKGDILPMIKCLLIILVLIYIYTIFLCLFKIKDIDLIINVIEKYLSSAKPGSYKKLILLDNYSDSLRDLLFYYPKIVKYCGFYTPTLEYGVAPETTYANTIRIYNDIRMERNYAVSNLMNAFNPIISIKKLLHIPSTVLNCIGFNLNEDSIKFINLIGWLFAYFLNLYGKEIKALISSLLNQ